MVAEPAGGWPFQIHSRGPPPSRMAAAKSVGVDRRSSKASIRLDLPDAFGPISTLSGPSSRAGDPGAKERKPSSRMLWMLFNWGTSFSLLVDARRILVGQRRDAWNAGLQAGIAARRGRETRGPPVKPDAGSARKPSPGSCRISITSSGVRISRHPTPRSGVRTEVQPPEQPQTDLPHAARGDATGGPAFPWVRATTHGLYTVSTSMSGVIAVGDQVGDRRSDVRRRWWTPPFKRSMPTPKSSESTR